MDQEQFERAQAAIEAGDSQTAMDLLAAILRQDPRAVPAWIEMSKVRPNIGERRECIERALALEPNNADAHAQLENIAILELITPLAGAHESEVQAQQEAQRSQLGTYLVDHKIITPAELDTALAEQRRSKRLLGDILVSHGWLTAEMLVRILVYQHEKRLAVRGWVPELLGDFLVKEGKITSQQLADALAQQVVLRQQGHAPMIGELLLQKGYLTVEMLRETLESQREYFYSRFG